MCIQKTCRTFAAIKLVRRASRLRNNTKTIMVATISYNPRNRLARKTMDYMQSLGVFKIEYQTSQKNSHSLADDFRGAMQEMKASQEGKIQLRTLSELLNEL